MSAPPECTTCADAKEVFGKASSRITHGSWPAVATRTGSAPACWEPQRYVHRCSACGRLWHVLFAGYDGAYGVTELPASVLPLADGSGTLSDLWPHLHGPPRELHSIAQHWLLHADFDVAEAVEGMVARLGGSSVTAERTHELLMHVESALQGASGQKLWQSIRKGTARPVRLKGAPALLAVLDRSDLLHARDASSVTVQGIRDALARVSHAGIGRDHGRAVSLLDLSSDERSRLLDATSPQGRLRSAVESADRAVSSIRRSPLPTPGEEPPPHLDAWGMPLAELKDLQHAVTELDTRLLEHGHVVTTTEARVVARVVARLDEIAAVLGKEHDSAHVLARRWRRLLQGLARNRRVPPEAASEVAAALGIEPQDIPPFAT